ADGEYKFTITGLPVGGYIGGLEYEHTLIITIDGQRVFSGKVGGEEDRKAVDQQQARGVAAINGRFQNIPVPVTAGPHKVVVTFVARNFAESDVILRSVNPGGGVGRIVKISGVDIVGPFSPVGIKDTPSRARVFVCKPATAAEELPCATQILTNVAKKAFRRPVTERDLAAPVAFYKAARNGA